MRRAKSVGTLLLLSALLVMAFAAIGGIVISWGSISQPSIHSTTVPLYSQPERDYLGYLKVRGISLPASFLLMEGKSICSDFQNDPGLTYQEEVTRSEIRMGKTGVSEITKGALIHLCDGQGL